MLAWFCREVRDEEKVGDRDEPKLTLFSTPTQAPQLICSNINEEKGSFSCCAEYSRSTGVREVT